MDEHLVERGKEEAVKSSLFGENSASIGGNQVELRQGHVFTGKFTEVVISNRLRQLRRAPIRIQDGERQKSGRGAGRRTGRLLHAELIPFAGIAIEKPRSGLASAKSV